MSQKSIKIIIADDHTIVRTGLTALLGTVAGMEIVGSAADGEDAVRLAIKKHPDVVIMDLVMPKKNGIAATQEIKSHLSKTKVLILTSYSTSDGIVQALEAGASGAVLKNSPNNDLISAIRAVAAGEYAVSAEIRHLITNAPPVPELTARQREVLASLIRGLTNRDIANQLAISEDRIEQHVKALFAKLGAANRTEAVAIALRKHLLKI